MYGHRQLLARCLVSIYAFLSSCVDRTPFQRSPVRVSYTNTCQYLFSNLFYDFNASLVKEAMQPIVVDMQALLLEPFNAPPLRGAMQRRTARRGSSTDSFHASHTREAMQYHRLVDIERGDYFQRPLFWEAMQPSSQI